MTLKIKRVAIAILGILLTLSISVSLAFYNNTGKIKVSADTESAEGIHLNETYGINEEIELSKNITFEHNGATIEATDGVIVYPNGTSYVINPFVGNEQSFILDTLGQYTLRYYSGDVTYYDYFVVESRLYSLSDYSSSTIIPYVKEGEPKDFDSDIYRNHKSNVTCAAGTYVGVKDTETEEYVWDEAKGEYKEVKTEGLMTQYKRSKYTDGLIVKMKEGVTFNYAEPINLNDVSEDGLSNIMSFSELFIEFFDDYGYHNSQRDDPTTEEIEPTSQLKERKEIATSMYVTLTDAYDPTNYVQVLISWEGDSLYARASTAEIASQAISVGSLGNTANYSREAYYGSQRTIVYTDRYGSSCGIKPNAKGYTSKIHLRYDNEKGIMYWGEEKKNDIRGGTTEYSSIKNIDKNIIMDLKDPAVTGGPVFPGFTTGEVYLSLYFADAKYNEPARVDIYSIGNKNAYDIINASETYSDDIKPLININAKTTINNGVYAKVGDAFSIPSANAFDVNLKGNVSVNVYRGYGTELQSSVEIKDGKFNVAYKDIYYIVYTATDYYGNVGEKVLKVYGVDKDIIDFNVTDVVEDTINIMEQTPIVLGEKLSTRNNYNDLKLKIEFISEKESFVYADLKNGSEIDAFWDEEHEFSVKYAGEYTIRFTYSDNAVSYVYDETFTVLSNAEKMSFSNKPFIPRILLKNAVYDFESVDVFGYANGEPEKLGKANLQIKFDDGDFTDIENIRKVEITGSKTAVLRAVYGNNSIESDVAIIKDVNYAYAKENGGAGLRVADYFHYNEKAFTFSDDAGNDLVFVSNNHQRTNTLQFANMVSVKDFELIYQIPSNLSNYNKISFIFTDPYNPENVLNVSMYKKAGAVYYSYNGVEVKSSLQFGVNNEKIIKYHESSGGLTLDGVSTTCATDVKFTTPLAYFDIVLDDIRGQAGIYILQMNYQQLKQVMRDRKEPELISDTAIGRYGLGQNVVLPAVKFVDLLSIIEYDTIDTMCIYNDEEFVTSIDGVLLDGNENQPDKDYTIKLKEFGSYTYYYYAVDAFENELDFFMIFDPVDKTAPTIEFTGNIKDGDKITVKVGDTIDLQYTVSDNYTTNAEDLATNIIIRDCDKAILYPANSNLIKFDKIGRYEVSIVCQDQANNVTIKSFEVVVEPA